MKKGLRSFFPHLRHRSREGAGSLRAGLDGRPGSGAHKGRFRYAVILERAYGILLIGIHGDVIQRRFSTEFRSRSGWMGC